jgi:hypothetical protein
MAKKRHRQRHVQRAVLPGQWRCAAGAGEQPEAHGHRFQLQRDVRDDAEHRDEGDRGGQAGAAPEPRGDQVRERGGVVFARQPHHPLQHAEAEAQYSRIVPMNVGGTGQPSVAPG